MYFYKDLITVLYKRKYKPVDFFNGELIFNILNLGF